MKAGPLVIKISSQFKGFVEPFRLKISMEKIPTKTVTFILVDKTIKAAISFPNARAIFEGLEHNYEQFILGNGSSARIRKVFRLKKTPLYGRFTYHVVIVGKDSIKFANKLGHSAPKIIIENDY
jgi:hypothetical protein